ncbi:proliferation marker protein Ki-67 isoform X2 [Macrotis lagotis]|uniref:proliferation marker protein Ki-67 isoform X2 n=1 Tax=Macrotis lagotis TaxID=92651 RepID=UPI003D69ABD6
MNTVGYVVIVRRSGNDGFRYPLTQATCLLGRSAECDIRLQLPGVAKQQCKIEFNQHLKEEAVLTNLNSENPTLLNGITFCHPTKLEHGDIITIFDRSFRFEYENGFQNEEKPRLSEPEAQEVILTRTRRKSSLGPVLNTEQYQRRENQSFGKISTKYTEENIGQFSLTQSLEEKVNENKSRKHRDASDNVEDLSGEAPSLETKELGKIATHITDVDLAAEKEKEAEGCEGDQSLSSSPKHPEKNEKHNFSPFRKLFGLMKDELNSKCQQTANLHSSPRNSGPHNQISLENLGREGETELLHLPHSKPILRRSQTFQGSIFAAKDSCAKTERCFEEDTFKNPFLEKWNEEKILVEAQDQESQQLSVSRKRRRSEELLAEKWGKRKSKEDKRRSAPVRPPPKEQSLHSLYTLRSQTKRPEVFSLKSGRISKLGSETPEKSLEKNKTPPAEKPVLKESDSNGVVESVDLPRNKGSSKRSKSDGNQFGPKKIPNSEHMIKKIQDEIYFEDNVNENDESSAKRRRVSFGVNLRPELFDENLPPNTPLKRGETPAVKTSFRTCSQTVQKKSIIKDHSKLSEKEPASEGMLHFQDPLELSPTLSPKKISRSHLLHEKAGSVSAEFQPQTMKRPSSGKRHSSGRRSQHDTMQMIYSKRRSGASEANLMVVHSWADVVRLGTRKPQVDMVKHGIERRRIKKQKKLTPKKPTNQVQKNVVGTGHANSPCTIVIGRAHTEKVTVPVQPCRVLNNFVFSRDMDMNEDLTGLADMFQTPMNKKQKNANVYPESSPVPQFLSGEKSFKTDASSGDESLLHTSAEKVIPTTLETTKQIPGQSILCRRSPRNRQSWNGGDEMIKTLKEISETTSEEIMKIPLPDVDVDHKKLTPSSRKVKTTLNQNESTPYLNRIKTPQDQKVLGPCHPETIKSRISTFEDIWATEIVNKGEPKEKSANIYIDLNQNPKMPSGSLGVMASLNISPHEEQLALTNQSADIQNHIKISSQNKEANMTSQKLGAVTSLDVMVPSGTVTKIKHELGGIKKITTPKEKTESLEDLISPREFMTTLSTPIAEFNDDKDKVPDSARDAAKAQKTSRTTPKQIACSSGNAKGQKKSMKSVKTQSDAEDDLSNTEQLMKTPKRKRESVEHLTVVKRLMRTHQDKMQPGEDIPDSEGLIRTPKEKEITESHKSIRNASVRRTPKQKGQSSEDLEGLRRLFLAPEEKREPLEDLTGLEEFKTTPKQVVKPVKDKVSEVIVKSDKRYDPSGRLIGTPKEEKEPIEDIKSVKKSVKTSKQSCDPGDDLVDVKKPDKTPKAKPIEDITGLRKLKRKPKEKKKSIDSLTGLRRLMKTPREKIKPNENLTGLKRLLKTPKDKVKPIEDLTGIKRLMKTPKQKGEPVEDLAGIKRLMRTPKEKGEPIEELTGIQRLMRTPKEKGEPKEDLTGIRRLMRTPKEKGEPKEDLTGIRRLMRTPKEKGEPKEDLTGIRRLMRTPKEKGEPVEDLTGIKRLMRTPKEKGEPVEDLTGIKRLMRTPKEKGEPVEDLTGIKRLMRTPKEKGEPVEDLTGIKRLMRTPKEKGEPVEDLTGIKRLMRTPKEKGEPVEDLTGIKRLMRTPKEKGEPVEDLTGIKRLMRTPKEKGEPVEDLTDVLFMATINKETENVSLGTTVKQSKPQEISDTNSEFSETLQEIETLRRPPIKDFSASNQENQVREEILELPQGIPTCKAGGNINKGLKPPKRNKLVGDSFRKKKLETEPKSKSNFEVDYVGFKEMFESPKESKDQCQQQISISSEKDENKSDFSKINGLCSLNLEDNIMDQGIQKNSQTLLQEFNLPSESEKKTKKSLLRAISENQKTISLRSRSKKKSDSESLSSTKSDEKSKMTTLEKSVREMVELTKTRLNSKSVGKFSKTDRGLQEASSLSPLEKEEPVMNGSSTSWDSADNKESMGPLRPRRRKQAAKGQSCSSSEMSDVENSEQQPVKNLRERLKNSTGIVTSRSLRNRELATESDVSPTEDEKKLGKRLPRKLNNRKAPLRCNQKKTNKELQGSSPLLRETDTVSRENDEKKEMAALRSRNKIIPDTELQESSSLFSEIVSSHTDDEKPVKGKKKEVKEGIKKGMTLRSRDKNDIPFFESDRSNSENEREFVRALPDKLKQKVVLDSRNRNNSIEELTENDGSTEIEKSLPCFSQGMTVVNKDEGALRTRSRNKTDMVKQETNSVVAASIVHNEKKLTRSISQSRRKTTVNDKMECLTVNKKNRCMKALRSKSNTVATETENDIPGKLISRSQSKNNGEDSEKKPLKSVKEKKVKENIASPSKRSLRSGGRNREVTQTLLPSSKVAPKKLDKKNEKRPVTVQKNINETTRNGEGLLKDKNKIDLDSSPVPAPRMQTEKDAEKSLDAFSEISVVPERTLPLTRNRKKVNNKKLQETPLETDENKAKAKVEEPLRNGMNKVSNAKENQENTEKILQDRVVTKDLVPLRTRLRSKNDKALIESNLLPETVEIPNNLSKDSKTTVVSTQKPTTRNVLSNNTLKGTKPFTRSSKQINSNQTARKKIKV